MKATLTSLAFVFLISASANAQQIERKIGNENVIIDLKPATEGKGYSILHYVKSDAAPKCHTVSLTCSSDGTSASACCPTVYYDTFCPNARISCR